MNNVNKIKVLIIAITNPDIQPAGMDFLICSFIEVDPSEYDNLKNFGHQYPSNSPSMKIMLDKKAPGRATY